MHRGGPDNNNEEEDDEDHGESHDEFLDAEEYQRPMSMVSARSTFSVSSNRLNSKVSAESLRVRSKGEQNERATRLIGQKMLEGWAMLQAPCPNPGCNEVKKNLFIQLGFYIELYYDDISIVMYTVHARLAVAFVCMHASMEKKRMCGLVGRRKTEREREHEDGG